jgi:hypothetical protein
LFNHRTGIHEFALNVHDLDPVTKREVATIAVANRENDCEHGDDQKHKGSSAEEEPDEHAISHIMF